MADVVPEPVVRRIGRVWSHGWVRIPAFLAVGAGLGTLLGFFLTMAIFVARARAGLYVYSLDDLTALRWEALPTWIGLVAGAWVAVRSFPTFVSGALRTVAGAVLLAPAGWFVGPLLWPGRSAPWAGAVLAAAGGMLGGVAWAVLRRTHDPTGAHDA